MCDSSSTDAARTRTTRAFHNEHNTQRRAPAGAVTVPVAQFALTQNRVRSYLTAAQGATRRTSTHVRRAAAVQPPSAALQAVISAPTEAYRLPQDQAWRREEVYCSDLNHLTVSISHLHRAGSTASRFGSPVLRNTVQSWRSSGFEVSESRPSIIDENVDIGAQANPYGVYPIVFPFQSHPLSSFDQQHQSAGIYAGLNSMSLRVQGAGVQQHQVQHGCIASGTMHDYSAKSIHTNDSFGFARESMPATTVTYRDRSVSSSGRRGRKYSGGRSINSPNGMENSKAERRAAARVAAAASVVAASAKLFSAREKAEREATMTFDIGRRHRARAGGEEAYNVHALTARSTLKSFVKGTAPVLHSACDVENMTPPAARWWGGWVYGSCLGASPPDSQVVGVNAVGVSVQKLGDIGTTCREAYGREGGRSKSSACEDDTDSWLNSAAWKSPQVERKYLPVSPLNTLRSDDQGEKDGGHGTLLFSHDTSPLRGLDDRNSADMVDVEDKKYEANGFTLKDGNISPLRATLEAITLDPSGMQWRGFGSRLTVEKEGAPSRHDDDWLDAGTRKFISCNNSSPIGEASCTPITTENADITRTALCSANGNLEHETQPRPVSTQDGGLRPDYKPLFSTMATSAQGGFEAPTISLLPHISSPAARPETVQVHSLPFLAHCSGGIQQQPPMASLPSWAHHPPALGLDLGSSTPSTTLSGTRAPHARRDSRRELNLGGIFISNRGESEARRACTRVSMDADTLPATRTKQWICCNGECEASGLGDPGVTGYKRNIHVAGKTSSCVVCRRDGCEHSNIAACSFPGCRQEGTGGETPTMGNMDHSTRYCTDHEHDR